MPALRRYAWALLRNRDDADELVQDCLVRALGRLPTPSSDLAVRPWLFTILHNLSVSRWRTLRRRGRSVDAATIDLPIPPPQEWSLAARDMMQGLRDLPDEQRQVLLLVGVEGLEYREAAAVLGLPIGTVMSRLSRGRDALRARMEGRERPALRRVK
ncbi:sigma-70 family RNA polymerase sigma factor [Acidisphaera sp. L21]|uniref:sigma-70 family RNA polymerase sigma factor n=1 Tax=Acidisphaera sp. L21 TaxID=1641851 RepID=UPI003004276E